MTEPTYTLTFTAAQLAVIDAGLQEIPMKHAAPVVLEINRQITQAQSSSPEGDSPATPLPPDAP